MVVCQGEIGLSAAGGEVRLVGGSHSEDTMADVCAFVALSGNGDSPHVTDVLADGERICCDGAVVMHELETPAGDVVQGQRGDVAGCCVGRVKRMMPRSRDARLKYL